MDMPSISASRSTRCDITSGNTSPNHNLISCSKRAWISMLSQTLAAWSTVPFFRNHAGSNLVPFLRASSFYAYNSAAPTIACASLREKPFDLILALSAS